MVITVNYIPPFNFVYELQCFQGFLRRKKNVQRVLVLNLVKISKDFLIAAERPQGASSNIIRI